MIGGVRSANPSTFVILPWSLSRQRAEVEGEGDRE